MDTFDTCNVKATIIFTNIFEILGRVDLRCKESINLGLVKSFFLFLKNKSNNNGNNNDKNYIATQLFQTRPNKKNLNKKHLPCSLSKPQLIEQDAFSGAW